MTIMYGIHPFWIGERGRRALRMYAERQSFRKIAEALGTTRNAVAGYINRNRHRVNVVQQMAWSPPVLTEIRFWRAPEIVPLDKDADGWKCIQFVEDLPRWRLVLSGEDHHEVEAQIDPKDPWFPWKTDDGRQYRWDVFDWWRPFTTQSPSNNGPPS